MVSLVSAWELATKSSLGKVPLPCPVGELFAHASRNLLAQRLGSQLSHIDEMAALPRHHRDPFDRMIIAQALVERCAVMTSDESFAPYGLRVVW